VLSQELRHRVDVQQLTTEQDSDTGAVEESWLSIMPAGTEGTMPARIEAVTGKEFVSSQAVQAQVTTRIKIRRWPEIQPRMRVVHEGLSYNIVAVLPDLTQQRVINLMCESGVNDG